MQATEHIDFRQYWLAIKRHWLPATSVFGLVVVLTALTTILQKPVYEARGKLLIKKSNNVTSAIREEDLGQEKLNSVGRQSDPLNTEAEIIRSAPIARRTIATLKLEIKPNKFLPRLKVKQIGATDILEVSYRSPDSKEAAIVVNQIMNLYLENNVLANRTEAAAARLRASCLRGARARAVALRRRGRGQPHAAVRRSRRAGHRGVRLRPERRALPRAPASRGVRGVGARARARSGTDGFRGAVGGGDRGGGVPQRRRRGRE